MSAPSSSWINIPQRLGLTDEQWKQLAWQLRCDLRVACPGIVQSFDAVKQTVVVQLAIRENINVITADGTGNAAPVSTPTTIPLIQDLPIVIPRANGFSLTLPVHAGDECLVVFGDMCIDAWYQSGGVQNQVDRRRHDLSDGFAVLGCWSQPHKLSNYSTTAAQLRSDDGTKIIELTPSAINIKVTGGNPVNITAANSTIAVDAGGGDVTVHGAHVTISSSSTVTSIEGKNFLLHTHTGVQTGGGISGPVA